MSATTTTTRTTVHVEAEHYGRTVTDVWEFADPAEAARTVDARRTMGLIKRVTRIEYPDVDAEVAYALATVLAICPDINRDALARMLAVVRETAPVTV